MFHYPSMQHPAPQHLFIRSTQVTTTPPSQTLYPSVDLLPYPSYHSSAHPLTPQLAQTPTLRERAPIPHSIPQLPTRRPHNLFPQPYLI